MNSKSPSSKNSQIESESSRDPLGLSFVKERAAQYELNIPQKLRAIEELGEIIQTAKRSYLENLSKT